MNKTRILFAAKWLFIIGVAMLIVRNNNYPLLIKRSSDILFFFSAMLVVHSIKGEWKAAIVSNSRAFICTALIFSGIALASAYNYFVYGVGISGGGILEVSRFIEVAAIFFLTIFFPKYNSDFYKQVAIAQLSTVVYLLALLSPTLVPVDRFQLLENWPSNVGYYLIVSMSLIYALIMARERKFIYSMLYFVIFAGFFAILLWTLSRASWLGVSLSLVAIAVAWPFFREKNVSSMIKKIATGLFVAIAAAIVGFFVLSPPIKNLVLRRFFPQIGSYIWTHKPSAVARSILGERLMPDLEDQSRLTIWKEYGSLIAKNPLGLGLDYPLVSFGDEQKGPHSTPLEIWLLAGPLGFLGFFYLVFIALENVVGKIRFNNDNLWPIYLLSALAGIIVASLFDDMSTFRLMWILAGMALFWGSAADQSGNSISHDPSST